MNHAALETGGPYARDIASLFWIFAGVATVVYLLVIAALLFALWRRRRATPPPEGVPAVALRAIGVSLA
jgi:heme/copper-type cytochrome/quinol oxidase subunit 2